MMMVSNMDTSIHGLGGKYRLRTVSSNSHLHISSSVIFGFPLLIRLDIKTIFSRRWSDCDICATVTELLPI